MKNFRADLVELTKILQDFDKLCDKLRDYCNRLSNLSFEAAEMEKSVNLFNESYAADLKFLRFSKLSCNKAGLVDITEIFKLQSLAEAFLKIAARDGYDFEYIDSTKVRLKSKH